MHSPREPISEVAAWQGRSSSSINANMPKDRPSSSSQDRRRNAVKITPPESIRKSSAHTRPTKHRQFRRLLRIGPKRDMLSAEFITSDVGRPACEGVWGWGEDTIHAA